jgi:quinol monooxygenase YgiN
MVITMVEAVLDPEREADLTAAWSTVTEDTAGLPTGFVRSYLLRSSGDTPTWRIVTEWESMEALQRMRASVGTPAAVAMYKMAGAEPEVSVWEIRGRASVG